MGWPRTQKAVSSSGSLISSLTFDAAQRDAGVGFGSVVMVQAKSEGESWRCLVSVDDGGRRTAHVVTVRPADLERWASGSNRDAVEDLVRRSFDFLLEREPPSAILGRFELSVIQRYFPEYDDAFKRR
jgi:hypothetical protein